MNDAEVSMGKVVTVALWIVTLLLLTASWIIMAADGDWHVAALLGLTSTVAAAAAAISQCRWYLLRLSGLIQLAARGQLEHDAGRLRPLP